VQLLLAALVFTSCATSPGANDGDLIAGAANWEAQVRERLLTADAASIAADTRLGVLPGASEPPPPAM